MKFQDYYNTLNIPKNASAEDIRKAYKQQAKRYHPDINKSSEAEARFKEINEAYEVLKDPERKKLYDIYGQNWREAQSQQEQRSRQTTNDRRQQQQNRSSRTFHFTSDGDFSEAHDWNDVFKNFFHEDTEPPFHAGRRPVEKQEFEMTLPLADIAQGCTRTLSLQSMTHDAYGREIPSTRTLNVKIPQGMTDGSVLRIRDKDENGGENEILLRIRISEDAHFRVNDYDLLTQVAITPWEAALGGKIEVKTLQGSIHLTVPKNTQNGKKLRLRGKGLSKRQGGAGDMIVILEIQMPKHLTEAEEKLFRNLAEVSSFTPRTGKNGQRAAEGQT